MPGQGLSTLSKTLTLLGQRNVYNECKQRKQDCCLFGHFIQLLWEDTKSLQKIADRWNSSTLSALRSATGWTSPKLPQRSKLKSPQTTWGGSSWYRGADSPHLTKVRGIQGWKRDKQNWEMSENKATYISNQKWHHILLVPILNSQWNSSMKCHFTTLSWGEFKTKTTDPQGTLCIVASEPVVDYLKVNCSKGASIKWPRRPRRGSWGLV